MNNLIFDFFICQVAILAGALLVDVILGEYPEVIHPVVWVGKLIEHLDPFFRKNRNKIFAGTLFVIFVETLFMVLLLFFQLFSFKFILIYIVISVFFLKSSFSLNGMRKHIRPIIAALDKGDMESARVFLSKTVRRETKYLDKSLICSAAIETVSEGLVDGFTGPLFYFPFFLTPGAFFYRVSNTFDSEIGYNDERNREFGRFAAKLDTALNFIPSRLTAQMVYLSSFLIGLKPVSYNIRRMSKRTKSINAGWPMSGFSNVIGVRLEKKGEYIINENLRPPEVEDVRVSLKLHELTAILFTVFFTLPVSIIIYLLI